MSQPDSFQSDQLLDYHLGLMETACEERIRHEIARSEPLKHQSRNVSQWLELLDACEAPPPPTRLVDRVMARIERTTPLRITEAASSLPPSSVGGGSRRPRVSLRELVALAACIIFFIGVVVPGFARNRHQARRALCAANLGSIYGGLTQYAASFNGAMPQTAGFVPGVNWLRSPRPEVPRTPNGRNRYVLLRFHVVTPGNFICAAAPRAKPMDASRIDQWNDFPAAENCSFDSQNMAGPTLPLGEQNRLPIFADRNPLFDGDRLDAVGAAEINSRSHNGGAGQNVLCADGRVLWTTTPLVGPRGDNIWQVEGVTRYTGTEYQQDPTDTFVIP
jgi:hypothetical protein